MSTDFSVVEQTLTAATGCIFPAAQLVVYCQGDVVYQNCFGWLDPEHRRRPIQADTHFDLASLTKPFVATALLRLIEQGRTALDQPVCNVLHAFAGQRPILPYEDPLSPGCFVTVEPAGGMVDAGQITFRQLLAHNSGLPAWRPLFAQADATAARRMAVETHFSYLPGSHAIYSDIGLIVVGMAVEALTGQRLDIALAELVTQPLGLRYTRFLPVGGETLPVSMPEPIEVAPTEFCAWRRRRIQGEVHDENAWRLGGVAGHAGLFSTAMDAARFGLMFLQDGHPLLQPETVAEIRRLQSQEGDARRGLGFALWSPDPEASGNPFSPQAFGHTGFTGTSLWIDPERKLVAALMTNEVYGGRVNRGILGLRIAVHRALAEIWPLDGG
jgi:CubicO group peptidase (beta-lactamase class C family)